MVLARHFRTVLGLAAIATISIFAPRVDAQITSFTDRASFLAATFSPTWGVYSGFELYEHEAVREGSEEYLNSEKYETWERKLDGPLLPLVETADPLDELRAGRVRGRVILQPAA